MSNGPGLNGSSDVNGSAAADGGRYGFQVVPVAFDEYREARRYPPIGASAEAEAVAGLLGRLGGELVVWDRAEGRDLAATDARLREWRHGAFGNSSVLLWIGHGRSNQDDAWLVVPGRDGTDRDTELNPATLAEHVAGHVRERGAGPEWTLVVVEACGAAWFVDLLEAELRRRRAVRGVVLVATGKDQGLGYLAVFREALSDVLDTFTDNDSEISLRDLAGRLEDRLAREQRGTVSSHGLAGVRRLTRAALLPEPVAAPLDVFRRLQALLAALPGHERAHFARRGMGTALGELAWNFVGRRAERQRIARWLSEPDRSGSGLLVVTGAPGAGKSAVLGNVLLHSYPEIHAILATAGFPGGDWAPEQPLPRLDLSLPLTGATMDDVATAIARAAGLDAPGAALSASERAGELTTAVAGRGRPLTVMADGLDEASEPPALAALFRQLAKVPGVRIVVGTRPSSGGHGGTDLLDALGGGDGPEASGTLRIERDEGALAELLRTSLEQLRDRHGSDFDTVLGRVTAAVERGRLEFLHVGLVIHEILADPGLLSPPGSFTLGHLLGAGNGDDVGTRLFAAAVERVSRQVPGGRQLLEALALAEGRGLPQADRVWVTAASALGDQRVDETALSELQRVAAPYVMLDAEEGQAVYRLAHRTFQEYFLAQPDSPRHRLALATALLELAEQQEGPLNPYLARHLSGHLTRSRADAWDLLAARPHLLDRLDVRAVTADATRGNDLTALPAEVVGTVVTAHLAGQSGPADRRGLRRLGMAQTAGPAALAVPIPAQRPSVPREQPLWEPVWSGLRRRMPHLTLAGHTDRVRAVAAVRGADGARLLATGGDDGTVRIWDPATGHAVHPALRGLGDRILTLTALDGGRQLAVTAADRGRGRLCVLETRTWQHHDLPCAEPHVSAAALPTAHGGTLLAFGTVPGRIHLVDPATGEQHGRPLTGHVDPVTALAALLAPDGGTRLVSAGEDGTARIWDVGSGRQEHPHLTAALGPLRALAVLQGHVAVGGTGDRLVIWDPESGDRWRLPVDFPQGVRSLAALGPGSLAVGASNGTVSLLDISFDHPDIPADRRDPARAQVLTGHVRAVTALTAFSTGDGEDRLVSCGDDHMVKVWDHTSDRFVPSDVSSAPAGSLAALPAPNGPLLLGVAAGRLLARQARDGLPVDPPVTPRVRPDGLAVLDLGADGHRLIVAPVPTGGHWDMVLAVDTASGAWRELFPAWGRDGLRRRTAVSACAGAEGLLLCGWQSGRVRLWDYRQNLWSWDFQSRGRGRIRAVAGFARPGGDGVIAVSAAADGLIRCTLVDPAAPEDLPPDLAVLDGHTGWVEALAAYFAPDGTPLVASAGEDGTVRIWDPLAGVQRHVIRLGVPCRSLCVAGGLLAVGTDDGLLTLRLGGDLAPTDHPPASRDPREANADARTPG